VHAFRTEAQARAAYERFSSDGQAVQVRGTIQSDLAERGKDGGISATLADGDGNPQESGSGPSGRRALNEALFRRLNEEIERIEIDNGADASQPIDFICECSSATCMKVVSLSRAEYEAVREGPSTFIVAPGHEEPAIEDLVVSYSEFSVVEKTRRSRSGRRRNRSSRLELEPLHSNTASRRLVRRAPSWKKVGRSVTRATHQGFRSGKVRGAYGAGGRASLPPAKTSIELRWRRS
jgi:hypothetical protein